MTKIKTANLTGVALDWAVAKCEGKNGVLHDDGITRCIVVVAPSGVYKGTYKPTENWNQAGPIIERERIYVKPTTRLVKGWRTYQLDETGGGICNSQYGPTPLIAAMRCYSMSKLGTEVEIPEELI